MLWFAQDGIIHHRSSRGDTLTGILARSTADVRRAYWQQRYRQIGVIFARARTRGELREGVDEHLAAEMLIAPLFFRRLVTDDPITLELAEKMTALVLPGLLET